MFNHSTISIVAIKMINLSPMRGKWYIIYYPITTMISEKNTDSMHNQEVLVQEWIEISNCLLPSFGESNEVYDGDQVLVQEWIEISKCLQPSFDESDEKHYCIHNDEVYDGTRVDRNI